MEDNKQEYSGNDIDAVVTAKQRMAERDAEYASKFKAFASSNATPSKPVTKRVAKAAPAAVSPDSKNYSNEGKSVPALKEAEPAYSNEGKSVPAPAPETDQDEFKRAWDGMEN